MSNSQFTVVTFTALVVFFATTLLLGQVAISASDDFTKVGTRYVVTWSAHHKVSFDKPNQYGQYPLCEFDKEYTMSFDSKEQATAFIAGFNQAALSTGTLSTLYSPKIVVIRTTEDK